MHSLTKGEKIAPLVKPAITRELLKLYAQASGDHNPIHLDEEVAKKTGLPGVIAHGMLTMAFFGEFLHQTLATLGAGRVNEISCRFKSMTFPGDVITITGTVRSAEPESIDLDLEARNQQGTLTATGHAKLELA